MRRITNVRLPKPLSNCNEHCWWILLDDQDIVISLNPLEEGSAIAGDDWRGDWLSPMGIDLQMNGGLGLAFPELTFKNLPTLLDLLDRLWFDGVEAICPTFISCGLPSLRLGLEVLREARKENSLARCKLLGAHIEGPFLSKGGHGAHDLEYLSAPSLFTLHELIGGFEEEIDLFTLAPELNGALEVIKQLQSHGVVVCLGHSTADEVLSGIAFDHGVGMLTHAFNAMPGLRHRSPGPVGEAIKYGDIAIGLIADGAHVHPDMAVLLQRLASQQLVLVSDAISPYGLKDGQYSWGQRVIVAEKGSCRLQNGTLAGSTVSLLNACKNLARWSGEPASAIWSATISPRFVLEKEKQVKNFFLGKSLKELLRWTIDFEQNELCWQQAA